MSIHDTVNTELRQRGLTAYADQARPVVTALVERENGIADQIINAAREQGIDEGQVRQVLEGAGMHVEAAQAAGGDTGLADRVADLERQVRDALAFARRQGYTG